MGLPRPWGFLGSASLCKGPAQHLAKAPLEADASFFSTQWHIPRGPWEPLGALGSPRELNVP